MVLTEDSCRRLMLEKYDFSMKEEPLSVFNIVTGNLGQDILLLSPPWAISALYTA